MANNNTLNALNALADQTPGLNQKALKQVQAARDIGLQKQLGGPAAAPKAPPQQKAQQLATQQALTAGQDIVAQRQQAAGAAGKIRAAALQERQRLGQQSLQQEQLAQQARLERQHTEQQTQLRREELASRKSITQNELAAAARLQDRGIEQDNKLQIATLKQRSDLNNIGIDIKSKLIDSRLQFNKSERGRKFSNERQLADYIAATATSRQDFNIKMSQMKQMQDKKITLMTQAQAKLETILKQGFIAEQQDLDQASKIEITKLVQEMKEKIKREEAAAKNRTSIIATVGGIAGGIAGGIYGGPVGAAAGVGMGTAAGTAIAGATA
jgi:hypothetical protein